MPIYDVEVAPPLPRATSGSYLTRKLAYQTVVRATALAYSYGMAERVHGVEITLNWTLLVSASRLNR